MILCRNETEYLSIPFNAFLGVRRGRAALDISPHKSLLTTVENRLGSLVRFLKTKLEERIAANPTPGIILEMGKCLNFGDILKEEETFEVGERQSKSLKKMMTATGDAIEDFGRIC